MKRFLAVAVLAAGVAAAAIYLYQRVDAPLRAPAAETTEVERADPGWLDRLYSQNPREVHAATQKVTSLGAEALPPIREALHDPDAEAERLKGALKACAILGETAAPLVPDVASVLDEPGLTAEAALALSYMGVDAFPPLRAALSNGDPIVRRESLRSIGKLKERAPLAAGVVLPLLLDRMRDPDGGVRTVAATYLGILNESPSRAVPALIAGLRDSDPEVRRASAAALGSFGPAASPALPALRRAAADRSEDVAREAGRTLVKLQQKAQ